MHSPFVERAVRPDMQESVQAAPSRGASLRVRPDGVAIITLSNGPMNALHPDVLGGLFRNLEEAHRRADVKAIVVTGAGQNFSAGFDITLFKEGSGSGVDGIWVNRELCRLAEDGPKPVVAAIRGLCLGGGCEVAISCCARVGTPCTRIGLPELQLGIIPGFGGTQRLPRLVGVQRALPMMLTSQPLPGPAALKAGLLDVTCSPSELEERAAQVALETAEGRRPRLRTLSRTDRLEPYADALRAIEAARVASQRQSPNLTHPLLCLDAVRRAVEVGGWAGVAYEGEKFLECQRLPTHAGLVHIFFAQRATKRVRGVTDQGLTPRGCRCVAVVGCGLMGSGIATSLALAGVRVLLKEISEPLLAAGVGRVRDNLASRVKKGRMAEADAKKVMGLVEPVLDYSKFRDADMAIEAVIESIPLKQKIFADLDQACRPDCVLATNTSTIDITLVGQKIRDPTRIVGAHFFSPAHIMPLLEIVRAPDTPPQVVLEVMEMASKIHKTPVVVGNCTGFAVNRVFFPYTMAACMLVDAGLDPWSVDAAVWRFGMPMGPFRLSDLVGGDIGLHVAQSYLGAFPDRVYKGALIPLMNEAKRLGEKTGGGFYNFGEGRGAGKPAIAEVSPLLAKSRAASGLEGRARSAVSGADDVVETVLFPVVNEGCRVIAEGMVDKPADLDVACVLGMGFPSYRGGLIHWADHVGAARIAAKLNKLAEVFPEHAGFFRPCEYLASAAQTGRPLSAGAGQGAALAARL